MLVIANKELSGLTEESESMDLDFLITTAPLTIIREIILGVYKIKLSNIDALTTDPASVITTLPEDDAFLAAKNIFLYTPDENRILCWLYVPIFTLHHPYTLLWIIGSISSI